MRELSARIAMLGLFLLVSPESRACPNPTGQRSVADVDGGEAAAALLCPSPACNTCPDTPDGCTTLSGLPFNRLSIIESGPLDDLGVACFGVAKQGTGTTATYSLFDDALLQPDDFSFRRHLSTDGLVWDDGVLTTGLAGPSSWSQSVQCPDPRYTGPHGEMELFYNSKQKVPFQTKFRIAFATSSNGGVDWAMYAQPIVLPAGGFYPYMPSAVKYKGKYLLAFAWTRMADEAFIHVRELPTATSPESQHTILTTDALGPTGSPDDWDAGTKNRPRLVVDLDGERIHMFYSGFPLHEGEVVRDCGGIGHAVSCDGGATWVKTVTPVLQRRTDGNWNDKHVLKPALVWEVLPRRLRLYFEGGSCDPEAGGLGVAEALWNAPFFTDLCAPGTLLLADQAEDGIQKTPVAESSARILSSPNPTRGETLVGIELSSERRSGQADLIVYDVVGRVVRELWSGATESIPRNIAWDGRDSGGTRVADGRYLVRLRIDGEGAAADWVTLLR